ncbi:MAG: hypothetical protein AB7K24_07280 [Gemmataceae bacterium]
MSKKNSQSDTPVALPSADLGNGMATPPPEVADLLRKVDEFLKEGDPGKALDAIAKAKSTAASSWITNARGVCQLRLGNAKVALEVFRGLVLATGGILLRGDVPVVFKTNYAVALLLSGNMSGCQGILAEVRNEGHPAVQRLNDAIQHWASRLTFWQRINWYLGGQPDNPVDLSFLPGDLE